MLRILHRPAWLIATLSLLLAFVFLGTRGIWDPDEGRYTNVALNMLDSGDWLDPMRSPEVGHWTKPPMVYWLVATSVGALGRNPWAARLPIALAYLACIWISWRVARRLAPGSEAIAALAYATMMLPAGASQMVTTDFPLAAFQALAMLGFVEFRFGDPQRHRRWLALMWTGFALAFVTKGPPALLPLLAILAFQWLAPGPERHRVLIRIEALLFLLLATPWYLAVILGHPGLLDYFLGAEVVERIASDDFQRHGEWYGWLQIYLPTLLLGTLPWTAALWRNLRRWPAAFRRWRTRAAREAEAPWLLLMAWVALPLCVFVLARSRMPLYLLPLFVPLAVLVGRQCQDEGRGLPALRWLALWAALLLGLRLAAAFFPSHKDASTWAEAIRERVPYAPREVVFVEDMARYGIHLHLHATVEKMSLEPQPAPRFNPEYDGDLGQELAEGERDVLFITKQSHWPEVKAWLDERSWQPIVYGPPFEERVFFSVEQP